MKYKIIIPKEEPKQECDCGTCDYCEEQESIKILQDAKEKALKQETIEEAVRIHLDKNKYSSPLTYAKIGAKWQAERMYSEEDMIEFAEWIANSKLHGFSKQLYEAMIRHNVKTTKDLLKIWFEQFKKK